MELNQFLYIFFIYFWVLLTTCTVSDYNNYCCNLDEHQELQVIEVSIGEIVTLECAWHRVVTGSAILELHVNELDRERHVQQEYSYRDGSYYSSLTYVFNFTLVGERGISFCQVIEFDSNLIQMDPVIFNVTCFIATNYSAPNYVREPKSLTIALGEIAVFECQHQSEVINWLINGTIPMEGPFIQNTSLCRENGIKINKLMITAFDDEYNGSTIVCISITSQEVSHLALLFIQGELNAVSGAFISHELNGSVLFSWRAPFSLNLTRTEPDIAYCIEIYNTTCELEHHLISNCDVYTPKYELTVNSQLSDLYKIQITPRSNTMSSINGTILLHNGTSFNNQRKLWSHISLYNFKDMYIEAKSQVNFTNGRVIATIKVKITGFSDDTNALISNYVLIFLSVENGTVFKYDPKCQTFNTESSIHQRSANLILNCYPEIRKLFVYHISTFVGRCSSNFTSGYQELSTHGLQNVTVTASYCPCQVHISGNLVSGVGVRGLFAVVYSLAYYYDIQYSVVHQNQEDEQHIQGCVSGLAPDIYGVLVFSLNNDGLPAPTLSALPRHVSVKENDEPVSCLNESTPYQQINATLDSLHSSSRHTSICILCTFKETSAEACVAVIHPNLINNTGEYSASNLVVKKINREVDNEASGCIEKLDNGAYHNNIIIVSVFSYFNNTLGRWPILLNLKILSSEQEAINNSSLEMKLIAFLPVTISIFTLMCFIATIVAVSVMYTRILKKAKRKRKIDLQQNECYEITSLSRTKLNMERNPAYEEIRITISM